jgi:hypothetical protein
LTVSSDAFLDLTVDADHPFAAHGLGGLEGGRIRVGDDLGQAVVIAQVDEQHAAMVAHSPVHWTQRGARHRAEKRMTHPVCQAERAQSVL